jgi:hypothetical protein
MAKAREHSGDLIRRIHAAVNRSTADRLQRDQLIRSLQAEVSRLRDENAYLISRLAEIGEEHAAKGEELTSVRMSR